MGFGEQINEIVNRLPDNRQTLLFSANLPKLYVEFTKAELGDPVLIRLNVIWIVSAAILVVWKAFSGSLTDCVPPGK